MDFYLAKPTEIDANEMYQKAMIHVSIDPDLDMLRFDVDLDSLPDIDYGGTEVVA